MSQHTTAKVARYFAVNPGEEFTASYNAALGKDAYHYAVQNCAPRGGDLYVEYADGTVSLGRSYAKKSTRY